MARKHFFIASLPRSRTCWLANLLTYNDSFCFHEALLGCGSMADLKKTIADVPWNIRYIGDAEPNLGYVPQAVLDEFGNAKFVFVHRPLEDCVMSEFMALGFDGNEKFQGISQKWLEDEFRTMSRGLSHLWNSLDNKNRMMVRYDDLNADRQIKDIWEFACPDIPFPEQRYKMLRDLKVTQLMSQRMSRHPDLPFHKLIENQRATVLENRTAEPVGA